MHSYLEEYIYQLFTSIDVKYPEDLDMYTIAQRLGVIITYKKRLFRFDNEIALVKSTKRREWMMFGHEIGHYLLHAGNQFNMHPLFKQLQEKQADYFAYHFCVPTFMLHELKEIDVYQIMNLFNVEFQFAFKRLEIYRNKKYCREGII
jgi:hypothetical protein